MDLLSYLFNFLSESLSPYHAAAKAAALLSQAGYTRLEEAAFWNLAPGQGYYLVRGGSSVVAWRVPEHGIGGWRITAAHSDSPTFRIKGTAPAANGVHRLAAEGYGGMNRASWLDRPLTAAGRAAVLASGTVSTRLVALENAPLVIPSLAIHMDRALNDGHPYNAQIDLQPVWGPQGCPSLEELLAKAVGVAPKALLSFDVSLAVRQQPQCLGPDGAWFLAPRIDDLACAALTLHAFLRTAAEPKTMAGPAAPVWLFLDNEEVGSGTRQGAAGIFVRDTLDRILNAVPHSEQAQARALANSFCLSVDNAHAVHPNFPEKSDPFLPVRLGGGVVLKRAASQAYATTAFSAGVVRALADACGVCVQEFSNRADQPGGSTLGNLLARTLPVPMADIGLAQLAMHAAVETADCRDAAALETLAAAFYGARMRTLADDTVALEAAL